MDGEVGGPGDRQPRLFGGVWCCVGVIVDDAIFAVVLVKRRFGKIFEKYFVILLAVWQIRRTFVVENETKTLGIMKPSIENIRTIVSVLTAEERQLLKDTFLYGGWGDTDYEFLDENGNDETVGAWGYCTNDAREGKHFAGRVVATMFRSIYAKLCPANRHQRGAQLSHCNDWWGDGSGDMLFIRSSWNKAWLEWAKTPEEPKMKDYLFQFADKNGKYLGRVTIAAFETPTVDEALATFRTHSPSAVNSAVANGVTLITDHEQPLGEVAVGSRVYSNINQREYQVVRQFPNSVRVVHLTGESAGVFCKLNPHYPVVVKETPDEEHPNSAFAAVNVSANGARYTELIYGTGDTICKRVYFTADEFAKVVEAIKQFNDKK